MKFHLKIIIFSLFLLTTTTVLFSQSQKNDNDKIHNLIAKKKAYNKTHKFGYRIQLFNGNEEIVKEKRIEFEEAFPEIKTYREYNPPEWKIQVGNYKTKLEADQFLITIKKEFPSAITVPLEGNN